MATRGSRRGKLEDVWEFAAKNKVCKIKPFDTLTDGLRKTLQNRWCLVETKTNVEGGFSKAVHALGQVVGWSAPEKKLIVQAYNLSGDKDGVALCEKFDDLHMLPANATVEPCTMQVRVQAQARDEAQAALAAKKKEALAAKQKAALAAKKKEALAAKKKAALAAKKKAALAAKQKEALAAKQKEALAAKKKEALAAKKKRKKKRKRAAQQSDKANKRSKVTISSSSEAADGKPNEFSLKSVLKSFTDPRCSLFVRSLNAEMRKFPDLPLMTPKKADADPPDLIFGGRRKGYYKTPALCRVLVMQVFRWLRTRGEWFVKWSDPSTLETYDGRNVLAHAFTMKYMSLHKPAILITWSKKGYLKSTHQIFFQIRR